MKGKAKREKFRSVQINHPRGYVLGGYSITCPVLLLQRRKLFFFWKTLGWVTIVQKIRMKEFVEALNSGEINEYNIKHHKEFKPFYGMVDDW
jgi:hypothetical protein